MEPQIYPWKVTIDPPQVTAGGNARITIELTGTTNENLSVSLASSPTGFFTNLPASITVPTGNDEYSLDVTIGSEQYGTCLVTASSTEGMAAGACVCSGPLG
jgi:hypothetical protein